VEHVVWAPERDAHKSKVEKMARNRVVAIFCGHATRHASSDKAESARRI
jgi:hypothetical protein